MSMPPIQPPIQPPTAVAYASADPNQSDLDHLRLLSIFHYVWAGLLALFACFGLMYIFMGVMVVSGALPMGPPPPTRAVYTPTTMAGTVSTPPPVVVATPPAGQEAFQSWFGIFFIAFGAIFLLGGWTLAICTLVAGRALAKRRRRTFAIVVAALNCLMLPVGTVLGVFTLVVLLRESVRTRFEGEATA